MDLSLEGVELIKTLSPQTSLVLALELTSVTVPRLSSLSPSFPLASLNPNPTSALRMTIFIILFPANESFFSRGLVGEMDLGRVSAVGYYFLLQVSSIRNFSRSLSYFLYGAWWCL